MVDIKILGSGCKNCQITADLLKYKAEELGIDANIEKVTDMAKILEAGVMSTPGVIIDGNLVHSGGVPDSNSVASWLEAYKK